MRGLSKRLIKAFLLCSPETAHRGHKGVPSRGIILAKHPKRKLIVFHSGVHIWLRLREGALLEPRFARRPFSLRSSYLSSFLFMPVYKGGLREPPFARLGSLAGRYHCGVMFGLDVRIHVGVREGASRASLRSARSAPVFVDPALRNYFGGGPPTKIIFPKYFQAGS